MVRALFATCVVIAVAGCDPLAGASYFGDPLLTLHGDVSGTLPEPANDDDVSVALVWVKGSGESDGFAPVTESAVVEAGFPARFSLDLFHPPPPDAAITFEDGLSVHYGFLVAFPGADARDQFAAEDVVGIADEHVLVVVDDEASLAPLVALSPMLQSATVGFNLVDTGKDREAYEACTAATFPALAACEDDCATDCPEETDCLDACLAGCAPLSDAVRACRNVVDAVVPISSSIPLTLYPSPPQVSTLFTILNQSGTSAADDVDGSQ